MADCIRTVVSKSCRLLTGLTDVQIQTLPASDLFFEQGGKL